MANIVRFDPFREIATLREDVNRLFSRAVGDSGEERGWLPAVDAVETDEALVITAELPGMEPSDIDVRITDSLLTISGERRHEETSGEGAKRRIERSYGRFERSMTLPPNVNADEVTARCDKGVLTVRVPKAQQPEPRRVAVEGGQAA